MNANSQTTKRSKQISCEENICTENVLARSSVWHVCCWYTKTCTNDMFTILFKTNERLAVLKLKIVHSPRRKITSQPIFIYKSLFKNFHDFLKTLFNSLKLNQHNANQFVVVVAAITFKLFQCIFCRVLFCHSLTLSRCLSIAASQ